MNWEKGDFLHKGKAKSIYAVKNNPHLIWIEFNNNLTAFNGKKISSFEGKGAINKNISSVIFRYLAQQKINTHWVADVGDTGMICKKLKVIPLEVVVRNRLAGSTAKKFNFSEGAPLKNPLVEFYYKDDLLGDPFISSEQAVIFNFVSNYQEIKILQEAAFSINLKLKKIFDLIGIELIDFKLEFGKLKIQNKEVILLGDEISCDSCRLWDKVTAEKLDKDRFRLNLGSIKQNYQKVCDLLVKQYGQPQKQEIL